MNDKVIKSKWYEPLSEVLGHAILEEFGYPSSALRVMKLNPQKGLISIMSDSSIDSYDGKIKQTTPDNLEAVQSDKLLYMHLMDVVMLNGERDVSNFLLSENAEGVDVIPVDHDSILQPFNMEDTSLEQVVKAYRNSFVNTELQKRHGRSQSNFTKLIEIAEETLKELQKIDPSSLGAKLIKELDGIVDDPKLFDMKSISNKQVKELYAIKKEVSNATKRLMEIQRIEVKKLVDMMIESAPPNDTVLHRLLEGE
jgi:hypothetical protein